MSGWKLFLLQTECLVRDIRVCSSIWPLSDVLWGRGVCVLGSGTTVDVAKVKLPEPAQCIRRASAVLAGCSGRGRLQSLQGPYVSRASCASPVKGTGLSEAYPGKIRNQHSRLCS